MLPFTVRPTMGSMYGRARALRDLQSEERVLLCARRHPLHLLRTALPALSLLLVVLVLALTLHTLRSPLLGPTVGGLLVLAVPWLLWLWADWRADLLVLTDRRVLWIERTPFLRERRWEAPLSSMQNVAAISDGPVQKLLGCSDLVLDTISRGVQRLHGLRHAPRTATAILDAQAYAGRRGNRLQRLRAEMGLAPEEPAVDAEPPGVCVWRRHPWMLVRGLVLPGLLLLLGGPLASTLGTTLVLVVAGGVALLWGAWVLDDWRNDEVIAATDRIIQTHRSPLTLHEETWQASLEKIQDIAYEIPSPLAQLLDYGTVTVKTAGDSTDFELSGIPHPRQVSAELNRRLQLHKGRKQRALLREVEDTVTAVLRSHGL